MLHFTGPQQKFVLTIISHSIREKSFLYVTLVRWLERTLLGVWLRSAEGSSCLATENNNDLRGKHCWLFL